MGARSHRLSTLRCSPVLRVILRHLSCCVSRQASTLATPQVSTAQGLHVATMGGVWLALVEGFAGIRADRDGLCVRPRLPDTWETLTVHLVYRGTRVQLRIKGEEVKVETGAPMRVTVVRE